MHKHVNSDNEILDIVSQNDIVIGQEIRSVVHSKNISNFRVINGFICNAEKQLWIPRRHPHKKLFPLHLDASVGGHVSSGESYDEAFKREAQEELSLNIDLFEYAPIARLTPSIHGTSAFMWVYIIKSDTVPTYNKNDFLEYFWLSLEDVLRKISSGDKAKSDLPIILREIKNVI